MTPHPSQDIVLSRGGTTEICLRPRKFLWSASSQHYNSGGGGGGGGGGVHLEKKSIHTITVWGASVKAPDCKVCHKLGSAIFVSLAFLHISSKKRLFIYHFKAHTISNKLVTKGFAQKKGKKSYAATNMC